METNKPGSPAKTKLFDCYVRCFFCMKTLDVVCNVPRNANIRFENLICLEHPEAMVALEWEPRENGPQDTGA